MKRETERKKSQVTEEESMAKFILIRNTPWSMEIKRKKQQKAQEIILWVNQEQSSGFKDLQYNKQNIL